MKGRCRIANNKGKLFEIVEEKHWQVVFVGTEAECDSYIENPDHNEEYIIRESKGWKESTND